MPGISGANSRHFLFNQKQTTGYSFLDISIDAIFIVKWIFYY